MIVRDIMTTNVITISPDATLKEVGAILKEKRISGIPVVDGGGRLIGIVTLTDMLRVLNNIYTWHSLQMRPAGKDLSVWEAEERLQSKVKDIMTKEVFTITEHETIEQLLRIVFNKKIHTIPVTAEGKLIGIVGIRDLVYASF